MKKRVLFLCSGNSCHSQMAEGLLKHFYGDDYEVFSAGLNPTDMSKNAIEVMKEIGIDISMQTSTPVDEFLNQPFDIIITMCNAKGQPYPKIWDEAQKINWNLFDPSEGISAQKDLLKALRELRDDIKTKVIEYFHIEH